MSRKFSVLLRGKNKFILIGIIIALAFGVVGATKVFFGQAATPTAAFEAESGSVTNPAKIVQDTSASGGSTLQFASDTASDLPAAPAGYKLWKQWDFRNIGTSLPEGWTAQSSAGGNSAGTYRPQNVEVVPGVGLVHTAERAYVGAPIYTGKVYGRVNVPQFMHVRFRAYPTNFKTGVWPSFWARPQSGGAMEGEKDFLEIFGGHIGSTQYPRVFGGGYIITPYPKVGDDTLDFDPIIGQGPQNSPVPSWQQPHIYETQQVPGSATMWVDGIKAGTITAAGMSTSAARAAYATQFDDPSATWYFRTDFQISGTGTQAGVTNAGPLSADQVGKFAKWTIEWVQVYVPN